MNFSVLPEWARDVSRGTFSLLEAYVALLQKWNGRINLVGKSTEGEIWQRHIADSLQLVPLIPENIRCAADLGSGAGLPGMVLAIAKPEIEWTLVEQDQRKSAFLQEIVATLQLKNVKVEVCDIKKVNESFQLITARALASLSELFSLAHRLGEEGSTWLFPKGKNFATEVADAQKGWAFEYTLIPSKTTADSSIVSVSKLIEVSK